MFKRALLIFIIIMGAFYIFFAPREPFLIAILFKIIPMIGIILYALLRLDRSNKLQRFEIVMIAGIVVCSIADVAIAITFIAGLVIFLIGHIIYITGFSMKINWNIKRFFLIVIPIVIVGIFYGQYLIKHVYSQDAWLVGPVIAYVLVISIMVIMAFLTGNIFAIVGSILFYLSDAVLAWNMFIESLTYSTLYIMSTYYMGQLLIANSILPISTRGSLNHKKKVA